MTIRNSILASLIALAPLFAHADSTEAYRSFGPLKSEFYRNTAVLDTTLVSESWLWEIPDWMLHTDFPYNKKDFPTEAPFADSLSVVRLLGGWKDSNLPADRNNDENDLAGRDESGEIFYRWDLLKARLDPYVKRGYELTLVMDNIPYALAKDPSQGNYGQAGRPADYDEWGTFIRELCIELKRLYGEETANKFRFRMGTEFQDERRFRGSIEDYLKYYDYAAVAVKEILPGAGFGPFNRSIPHSQATTLDSLVSGNVSILKVAEHCANGTNYASGEKGSPMDFLARSFYYFSRFGENGELLNIQPDERMPEFDELWTTVEEISPKFSSLSREVHEYGQSRRTEEGLYGADTGARGAAQNLDTLIAMLEIETDRVWHWVTMENIAEDKVLLMNNGWLYSVFDRMLGGELYRIPVKVEAPNGNRQRALLSVKEDEAILVLSNWNIDRTLHTPDTVSVTIPENIGSKKWTPVGMLSFTEDHSVYDVIRDDLKAAGLLSQTHLDHRGEPATTVGVRGYDSMPANLNKGKTFVAKNWNKYQSLMKSSLTLKTFDGETLNTADSTTIRFKAPSPSVTVIVFDKE